MSQLEILQIPLSSRPPSRFSYSESDSQRTTTDTSTTWGPGTLSGRALLALGEATVRGINRLVIVRRLGTIRLARSLDKSMCDDLLELCRPAMYPAWIGKEASLLIFTELCQDPDRYAGLVVGICEWPSQEARLIILELMRSLSRLWRPRWQLKEIFKFLTAIIQVKEEWRNLVVEAANLLRSMLHDQRNLGGHTINILCTELSTKSSPIMPFAKREAIYSALSRKIIWMNLQAAGLPLGARLQEIISILTTAEKPSPQFFDALGDAIIFTSRDFGYELPESATNFLLNYCRKSTEESVISEAGSIHYDVEPPTVIERLTEDELSDFIGRFPPSSHVPTLSLILSGRVEGIRGQGSLFRLSISE
ncbi:hypothetical protein K438DRAFT_1931765 [Mycena galopus ATCC 62051]|nr:hypothetical protein K438DRAFT_1931765 [Mycena galopus ATCC 62051]